MLVCANNDNFFNDYFIFDLLKNTKKHFFFDLNYKFAFCEYQKKIED